MKSSGPIETESRSVAIDSRRGMELDMENLSISGPLAVEDRTQLKTANGDAEDGTVATPGGIIPARSGVLSDAERLKVARIRRNRNQGWMPTFEEFDFLLEIVERMSR